MRWFLLLAVVFFTGLEGMEPKLLLDGFTLAKDPVYFMKEEKGQHLFVKEEQTGSFYRILLERDELVAEEMKGKLVSPARDVALHEDGSLWMIASLGEGMGNVSRMDFLGKVHTMVRSLSNPVSLCFSPDYKSLYVMEQKGKGYALYLSADGKEKRLSDVLFSSKELEVDSVGRVYLIAGKEVLVLSKEGKTLAKIPFSDEITGHCLGEEGALFVTTAKALWSVSLSSLGD